MSTPDTQALAVPVVPARRAWFDLRRDGLKIAAFLGALLLLDVVLWLVLVRPVRAELNALEERKRTADQVERHESASLGKLRGIDQHVREVRSRIDTFYNQMLSTKRERLVPFQLALVKVGRDFGVQPEKVSMGSNELDAEGLDALSITFPLTGGYENLRRFLAALEDLRKPEINQFAIVRQVALTGAKEGGRALQLNVGVDTYFNAPELKTERAERAAREKAERARGGRGRR